VFSRGVFHGWQEPGFRGCPPSAGASTGSTRGHSRTRSEACATIQPRDLSRCRQGRLPAPARTKMIAAIFPHRWCHVCPGARARATDAVRSQSNRLSESRPRLRLRALCRRRVNKSTRSVGGCHRPDLASISAAPCSTDSTSVAPSRNSDAGRRNDGSPERMK